MLISPTGGTGPTHYPVTFHETGLPAGTSWSVTFNGTLGSSTTASIAYSVLNGGYSFTTGTVAGYTANVTGGPVTVNGAPVDVEIGFTSTGTPTYAVTFDETGLPSPPSWTVTLEGSPQSATTTMIQFVEVDGSYSFSVGAVTGYTAAPSSGTVVVSGGPLTRDIVFTPTTAPPPTYPITFTETGLDSGTSWSVTLAGTLLSSSTSTIATTAANGSYPYTVSSVTGYTASPASGTVTITGAGQTVAITFTATPTGTSPPPSPSGFLGLPGSDGYILLGILVAAIAAILFLVLARRPNYPIVFTETGLPGGYALVRAAEGRHRVLGDGDDPIQSAERHLRV